MIKAIPNLGSCVNVLNYQLLLNQAYADSFNYYKNKNPQNYPFTVKSNAILRFIF